VDYPALEKLSENAVKEKQKFERLVVSKENLLEMFGVSYTGFPAHLPPNLACSTINIRNTLSSLKSLTALPPPYIVAAP